MMDHLQEIGELSARPNESAEEAEKEREKQILALRAKLMKAEEQRLAGEKCYSLEEVEKMLEER